MIVALEGGLWLLVVVINKISLCSLSLSYLNFNGFRLELFQRLVCSTYHNMSFLTWLVKKMLDFNFGLEWCALLSGELNKNRDTNSLPVTDVREYRHFAWVHILFGFSVGRATVINLELCGILKTLLIAKTPRLTSHNSCWILGPWQGHYLACTWASSLEGPRNKLLSMLWLSSIQTATSRPLLALLFCKYSGSCW